MCALFLLFALHWCFAWMFASHSSVLFRSWLFLLQPISISATLFTANVNLYTSNRFEITRNRFIRTQTRPINKTERKCHFDWRCKAKVRATKKSHTTTISNINSNIFHSHYSLCFLCSVTRVSWLFFIVQYDYNNCHETRALSFAFVSSHARTLPIDLWIIVGWVGGFLLFIHTSVVWQYALERKLGSIRQNCDSLVWLHNTT